MVICSTDFGGKIGVSVKMYECLFVWHTFEGIDSSSAQMALNYSKFRKKVYLIFNISQFLFIGIVQQLAQAVNSRFTRRTFSCITPSSGRWRQSIFCEQCTAAHNKLLLSQNRRSRYRSQVQHCSDFCYDAIDRFSDEIRPKYQVPTYSNLKFYNKQL